MKLAIGGATGFVGAETLRLALASPAVTQVIAIGRRPVGVNSPKLQQIVLKDMEQYPEAARRQLTDVDACIWTVAVTPRRMDEDDWAHTRRVCHDYALAALRALVEAREGVAVPLRFIYYSGHGAERDQALTPPWKPRYCLMRGEAESAVLQYAAAHSVKAAVVRPGFICGPGKSVPSPMDVGGGFYIPSVAVEECAGATLLWCLKGIEYEHDPLTNDDMRKSGQQWLGGAKL